MKKKRIILSRTLVTERLILRPFISDDAADVFEYLAVPAVNCFACMKLDSLDSAKTEMEKRAKDEFYLAIVLKESGKVIGSFLDIQRGRSRKMKRWTHSAPAGC